MSTDESDTDAGEEMIETSRYRFGEFVIDVPDRQLWRGDTRIDLSARYFDALVLLVRERGRLVEKDRFFEEVWTDVVVSDSALTQCIKEIRKQLDDDASDPHYIETVPRHGYRFIGVVEPVDRELLHSDSSPEEGGTRTSSVEVEGESGRDRDEWQALRDGLLKCGLGTIGGGIAGVLGGLLYGFGLASAEAGVGTLSTLFVLLSLNVLVGLTGGFGVSLGLAGAGAIVPYVPKMRVALRVVGTALGGLFVGSLAKLLGLDAFNLLFGRAPAGITGGPEGAGLGAALAIGAHLGTCLGERLGGAMHWHAAAGAGFLGALAGTLISLGGGHLMGGSLALLSKSFAGSRLQIDRFGVLFGELHFGRATEVVLGGIEGLLFCSCVVGALTLTSQFGNGRLGTNERRGMPKSETGDAL